jgi:hypothetical protein
MIEFSIDRRNAKCAKYGYGPVYVAWISHFEIPNPINFDITDLYLNIIL